jgi:anaerobic ribonucleoside-triphosphate reductase activating protein
MLRVNTWLPSVRDCLGPGNRAVVWLQGCSRACPGCISPEMQGVEGGRVVDPAWLAEQLIAQPEIVGLTVSGGEPMDQPVALSVLLRVFKDSGLSTWVYTGATLESLVQRREPALDLALACTDVLVDGEYRQELPGPLPFRGSANQRLVRLLRTGVLGSSTESGCRVEVQLTEDGELLVIGVPPRGFLPRFRTAMARRGMGLDPEHPWVDDQRIKDVRPASEPS